MWSLNFTLHLLPSSLVINISEFIFGSGELLKGQLILKANFEVISALAS